MVIVKLKIKDNVWLKCKIYFKDDAHLHNRQKSVLQSSLKELKFGYSFRFLMRNYPFSFTKLFFNFF